MFHVLIARIRVRVRSRVFVALAAACFALPVAAARADIVVNSTVHVPAWVETNPCFPADVINLSGDIHVVITSTAAGSGDYRVAYHLNSRLSGVSITTGTRYVNSENVNDEWSARPPFPATHTRTYDSHLISQSGTDNYILHATMHETVTANDMLTATVDSWRMDCAG